MITEGSITVTGEEKDIPSKDMHAFYNRDMRINREISLLLAKTQRENYSYWYYPLAGTGIRPLRTVKEAKIDGTVVVNDKRPSFTKEFQETRKRNNVKDIFNSFSNDARKLSYVIKSFDFVDLDPYGSPNMFLDSIFQKLRHRGMACITATDTAPLCGTYPSTCKRKYWAKPLHGMMMKAIGLRILIRKCQLVAAQHEKALTPVLCYAGQHYFKACFTCLKSKKTADKLLAQHDYVKGAGPLWTGSILDIDTLENLSPTNSISSETKNHIALLKKEAKINSVGFYDVHKVAKKYNIGDIPKMETIIRNVRKKKPCSRTHYSPTGIKTDANESFIASILEGSTN